MIEININKINFTAETIRERLKKDWDFVVAVTGEVGVGKSTLAIQIARYIDDNFDLVKNIAYLPTSEELEDKFFALEKYSVFIIDEAVKVVYKLRWQEKLQIRINEMYSTERWQNKCTFLLIPRFTDLNEFFRNQRVKLWIHILARGYGLIFKQVDENIFASDTWKIKENYKNLDEFLKKNREMLFNFDREKYEKFLEENCINYVTSFEFDDLEEKTKNKYKELKALARPKAKQIEKEYILSKERELLTMKNLLLKGYTQKEIGEIMGMTQQNVSFLFNKYIKEDDKITNV